MDNEYTKLTPGADQAQVQEYVRLLKDIKATEARLRFLRRTAKKHNHLNDELWLTADGQILIVADITDDHLVNIVGHCRYQGREVPERIQDEIYKRGLQEQADKRVADKIRKLEAEGDDEPIDLDNIPF